MIIVKGKGDVQATVADYWWNIFFGEKISSTDSINLVVGWRLQPPTNPKVAKTWEENKNSYLSFYWNESQWWKEKTAKKFFCLFFHRTDFGRESLSWYSYHEWKISNMNIHRRRFLSCSLVDHSCSLISLVIYIFFLSLLSIDGIFPKRSIDYSKTSLMWTSPGPTKSVHYT